MKIRAISHPIEILHGGGVALACGLDGELRADELHGLFAGDTRVMSTYRLTIAGYPWRVLARSRPGPSIAQWDLQNPTVRIPGGDLREGLIHLRLRRRVLGVLHDDLTVTSYADRAVTVRLGLQVDSDFADVFQVKARSTPPRLAIQRIAGASTVTLGYQHADFRRGLHVSFTASSGEPVFTGAQVVFMLVLEPRQPWRCCVSAVPELDGHLVEAAGDPHASAPPMPARTVAITAPPIVSGPFDRGCLDLDRLAIVRPGGARFVAAGAPWFLALFGRDMLVTSLMAPLLGAWHLEGALTALAATQAQARDDVRDASPGKIAHELRHGELAHFGVIPHTPYYGTHDAPALYVLALWNAFRWLGPRALVERWLDAADAALAWCTEHGDEDGDGLLEYRTRSPMGYRNQSWKDAHDAVPHQDGSHAELPIATVELQGYWYAARLAMAELREAMGDRGRAEQEREAARALRERVERTFWMDDEGCYAFALDGHKRLVRSIASNAGHLLWCGLPSRERAVKVARRLLQQDMFSGYGVRTLSSAHRAYNPLSYQLGSVWPHDNALIAAGLVRYGLRDDAARVVKGILDAADLFDESRLPELFCGFDHDGGPPVPYEQANVPQAWAAATGLLIPQLFVGLVPDVPRGRCYLSPWLPDWLPELSLRGIEVGDGLLDVTIGYAGAEARIIHASHPRLEIVRGTPIAPLWGRPVS